MRIILFIFQIFIQKPLKFTGRFHLIQELFYELSSEVVQLIWASGFRCFIAALPTERGRSDHFSFFPSSRGWWIPLTHIWVGELTISPMSFSTIIEIAFGGTPVPFDISYCNLFEGARGQYVRDLLEFMPT